MKITFVIDSLVHFDIPSFLLELLLSFDERAKIVTLAYQPQKYFGRFKNHKITASSINHFIKTPSDLKSKWCLAPSASLGAPFEKGDTIIVLSSGFAHALVPPELRKEAFLYLFDWQDLTTNMLTKLFHPYVEKWRKDALTSYSKVTIAHSRFKELCPHALFLGPTFSTADFFISDQEETHLKHLVYTDHLTKEELRFFKSQPSVDYFGPYDGSLFKGIDREKLIGDHCDGTLQSHQIKSKVIWDLSGSRFPHRALRAQLAGKMVVVREGVDTSFLHPEGFVVLNKELSHDALLSLFNQVDQMSLGVDKNQLRRSALKWNERFFKTQFQYFIRDELS